MYKKSFNNRGGYQGKRKFNGGNRGRGNRFNNKKAINIEGL